MASRTARAAACCFFSRWMSLLLFTVVCDGVQVSVRDERRFAMLFQSVVLPCQYSTVSSQTPVVQWWYKSYCRERTRDAFRFPDALAVYSSELGSSVHLDCGDSGRTVRIVASGQGSSITLAEHYKGRDIAIINKADLRIGELQWGDSGVYYCKVVISDDLEGQTEAHVELLVLGQTGLADDLLPGFNVEIVPEWLFVCAVVVGSLLLILLVGVCWCQCCPHSCCCYVRCCCCPDTCCCPRHLYEAGKGIKSAVPTPVPVISPYYIPGMPTMVPIVPPSLIEPTLSSAVSMENGSAACGMSELSSLHDVETDFRQSYRQVQKKALPAIHDLDDPADLRTMDLSPIHEGRYTRQQRNRVSDDNLRWNPRSEHLQRKAFLERGRTGSVDELEQFAMAYMQRGRHGDVGNREDEGRAHERERMRERDRELERDQYPFYCSKRYSPKVSPARRPPSPPPVPGKRPEMWDNDQQRDPQERDQSTRDCGGTGSRRGYDDALLNRLLERKAKAGVSGSPQEGRTEEDSDTPSKTSSKKISERVHSRSPSNQSPRHRTAEDNESLPPYTEKELQRPRGAESRQQPSSFTRSEPSGQEEQNRPRKVSTLLSRDSLVV